MWCLQLVRESLAAREKLVYVEVEELREIRTKSVSVMMLWTSLDEGRLVWGFCYDATWSILTDTEAQTNPACTDKTVNNFCFLFILTQFFPTSSCEHSCLVSFISIPCTSRAVPVFITFLQPVSSTRGPPVAFYYSVKATHSQRLPSF